ncbi:MAG: hypothetical protein GTN49_00305 [candidate division Zixibacteria bacterium]|nr:hypothetical protein [candidate division Zixibacteria bacterium]
MDRAKTRIGFLTVLMTASAVAAFAYIHTYSGFLTGTGDVDTFSFTTSAELVEIEFNCFSKAVVEVDVTRDGKYLCTFGVDGVADKARLVNVREDERGTGNVKVEDEDGKALVRIKGGGEYYIAARSVKGSAEWGFAWREASE